jgi:hypothetical protein
VRNLNQLLILTNYGISIDQSMLGIGEVWYFSPKTAVFSANDGFTMPSDEQHCSLVWYFD